MDKRMLRKHMLMERERMTPSERWKKSRELFRRIKLMSCYRECEAVYCFASFRNEVDTYPFMQEALEEGKRLALPKVMGREMSFYYIKKLTELQEGFQGIPEPPDFCPVMDEKILLIVPGLAFDHRRYRIGYGGGYYDRYLSQTFPSIHTVGVCFDFQIIEDLHPESFDKSVDEVITPAFHF